MPIPLRIQVFFHWASPEARRLAESLFDVFCGRPGGRGPRIPVRFGRRTSDGKPMPPALEAEHEVVVVLVDQHMTSRMRESDRECADAWGDLVADLLQNYPRGECIPHRVLPVALDQSAFNLSPRLEMTSFVRLERYQDARREQELVMHVAARAMRALRGLPISDKAAVDDLPDIPLRLFISHAKGDLPKDPSVLSEGAVKSILATLCELPVDAWYDANRIPAGGRFDSEIQSGILESTAIIAVLTDQWSSREWCRREVLEAKSVGRPLVVVDALESRVVRLFPYLGNAPILRWRAAIADSTELDMSEQRRKWEVEDARTAIEAALVEALRYQHAVLLLKGNAADGDVVLGAPPEALTLSHLPANASRVWYPDPPLGKEELERLGARDEDRKVVFSTPLAELARLRAGTSPLVALSLSGASDAEDWGGSAKHLALLADDVAMYLLVAGARIAYGGVIGHDALQGGRTAGDDINYVQALLATARAYSPLVDIPARFIPPIENWVAWPLHCRYGIEESGIYSREAALRSLGRPPDLTIQDIILDPEPSGFFAPTTKARRYAFAVSLTFMRESMTRETAARILMGGKLMGFAGLMPGVLEEGLLALKAHQPLFPIGVFGGAARLMIDLLRGIDRDEMTTAWFSANVTGWTDLADEYRRYDRAALSPEEVATELKATGAGGLAAALNNGLSENECLELANADDPRRIVELILRGLAVTGS